LEVAFTPDLSQKERENKATALSRTETGTYLNLAMFALRYLPRSPGE
jgi:hypothetical protein